jgi:glyoxylase-like metal-dependent hydrolase (beta-lactamase superfamily II)
VGFTELADRVWVTAPESPGCGAPVVTAVAGSAGLLLVDAPGGAAGQDLVEEVRRLGAGPVTAVALTHAHLPHVAGTAALRESYADRPVVVAHENAAEEMEAAAAAGSPGTAGVVAPGRTFSSALVLDLGDRAVELVHPGRAHTAGDLVVRVPDADVVVAGDLVTAAGPAAYGPDCWPLDWPVALDVVLQLTTAASVVVTGHGPQVDRDAVAEHRALVGIVAETVRDAAGRGVPPDEALAGAEWRWPRDAVAEAVRRGYGQLPRARRRLPLL